MESIDLQMEDIFGAEVVNDVEDIGAEQNPSAENPEEEENTFDANITAKIAKGAAKKVVRNPQPKLDPQRLSGERGIAILPKLFENVKFKGKGYEAQDLEKVIKGLEHWAHRLFPKRTFDECLQTIEKLGNKREVKTTIKKIRLDMPILDEDFVSKPEDVANPDIGPVDEIQEAENAFDEMMQASSTPQLMSPYNSQTSFSISPSMQPGFQAGVKSVLSDEQKEKIERNRRLALEKRAQKLQKQNLNDTDNSLSIPSSQTEEKQVVSTTICQDLVPASRAEPLCVNAELTASDSSLSIPLSQAEEKQVVPTTIFQDLVPVAAAEPSCVRAELIASDTCISMLSSQAETKQVVPMPPSQDLTSAAHEPSCANAEIIASDTSLFISSSQTEEEQDVPTTLSTPAALAEPPCVNAKAIASGNNESIDSLSNDDDDGKQATSFEKNMHNGLSGNASVDTKLDSVSSANGQLHSSDKNSVTLFCDESVKDVNSDEQNPLICTSTEKFNTFPSISDNSSPINTDKDSLPSTDEKLPNSDLENNIGSPESCDES